MKKKIFIMGKVYDMNILTASEIEKDVQNRLRDFTRTDIEVHLIVDDHSIIIEMMRYIDDSLLSEGRIIEQDSWLITGEGYKGFTPVNSAKTFPHYPNINNYFDIDDVCSDYQKDALYYGASRIKGVTITETSVMLSLTLMY